MGVSWGQKVGPAMQQTRVEDPARVERSLFEAFGDKRSHPRREFFTVDPHRAAAVIKLVEVEDVTNQGQIDTSTGNEDTVSVNRATARAERLNFEMLDIQVGEILEFVKDPEITCRVVNQKPARVEYEGEIMFLSVAAQKAMNYAPCRKSENRWKPEESPTD